MPFLNHKYLRQGKCVLAGPTVAMVTKSVTTMITTCIPMSRQFFDTMIVASTDKGCL